MKVSLLLAAALVRCVHGFVACTYIGIREESLYDRSDFTEFEYGVCRNSSGHDHYLVELKQINGFQPRGEYVLDLLPVAFEDFTPSIERSGPGAPRPTWAHAPNVGYSIRKVLKYSSPPAAATARISSSNVNCYARACGSKTFLHVIMSYSNKGPTQFGMGTVDAVTSQTFTATENIAGLLAASSYGLLTVQPPPASRVELVDMGSSSETGTAFCATLTGTETLRAIAILNAAGIDTSTSAFDVIEFIFPGDTACWFAGQAEQGGQRSWVDSPTFQTRTHEIGHTIGMLHSSALINNAKVEEVTARHDPNMIRSREIVTVG